MNAVGIPMMAPQGTILPGTAIQLGNYAVVIDKYIAEGGFAHVYLATLANGSGFPVVVKRIAVADKERLAIVNKEIETMKRLGKHKNIVEYMDSCMGKLEGGGYEVLILMEYCGGGPVIDLMNRRLQHRLTEPEILKIFSNVCEAVAYLHYSDPPILHRDIKVENILLSHNDYKLCDFGSATTNILRGDNIPRNVKDIQLLEEEINNHTTLQYRAPEMVDLYMRKGIDEKIDIWALGVLLYKLCYYTTPFEEQGQLAILNVRYTIPEYPVFSPGLVDLFKSMLKEDPRQRPNIYQVMKATSALRGLPCPIKNKYPETTSTLSGPESQSSATANILSNTAVVRPMDVLPSIEPMRRGRPTRPQTQAPAAAVPVAQGAVPADPNSGFDDSFGQFSQIEDPASQFSKIPPLGDAFDFGNSPSFDNGNKSESKRFTLDFESGKNDFGFDFTNTVTTQNIKPNASSSTMVAATPAKGPRPPSINFSDHLLLPESSQSGAGTSLKDSISSQLSGANSAIVVKPTADDLFFGSSAGIQFENTAITGPRAGTPSSFNNAQQSPIGLSSLPSNIGYQSSSPSMAFLPPRQVNPITQNSNSPLNRNVNSDSTESSRMALPSNISPNTGRTTDSDSRSYRPNNTGISGTSIGSLDGHNQGQGPLLTDNNLELLQRQQMEQLGRFSLDLASSPNPQNAQGKAKVLDPSKTLDGMRSLDMSLKNASTPSVSGSAASTPPALAPRPQPPSSASLSSAHAIKPSETLPVDRKAMAQRDLETELKLIKLQQKEFEQQQQQLLALQRRELEEQQRQHRLQQEQLQKQQQQQIQQQQEKWQERKRLLKEQEQLTQKQLMQQRDLERQHEDQKQLQQQQQQQQQRTVPDVSNLATSMGSISLIGSPTDDSMSTTFQRPQQSSNPYRLSLSDIGNGQKAAVIYPASLSNSGNLDYLTSLTNSYASSASSSPSASLQNPYSTASSSPSSSLRGPDFSSTTTMTPSVPTKSARRTGINGTEVGTGTCQSSGPATPTSPAATTSSASNVKPRRTSFNLPPGQKPELLPKPTRFRMKDGTGTLVAGEEEAFKKKFPSADLDDDLIFLQQQQQPSTSSTTASTVSSPTKGSKDVDVAFGHNRNHLTHRSSFEHNVGGNSSTDSTQHMTPSQRARAGVASRQHQDDMRNGLGNNEEEEEEEETLIRSRRRQYVAATQASGTAASPNGRSSLEQPESLLSNDEEPFTPTESVRERVQRMNRVGRIA